LTGRLIIGGIIVGRMREIGVGREHSRMTSTGDRPHSASQDLEGWRDPAEEGNRPIAALPGSVPEDLAAGGDPMPEIPGGPQVDVPAAQGHRLPEEEEEGR
jgi:hypothetical protein